MNHLNGKGWTLSCDLGPGVQEETAPFTEFRADVSLNVSKHRARAINKVKLTQSAGLNILFFPHKDTNNSCFVQNRKLGFIFLP